MSSSNKTASFLLPWARATCPTSVLIIAADICAKLTQLHNIKFQALPPSDYSKVAKPPRKAKKTSPSAH